MCITDPDRIATSVDPDRTVLFGSTLFARTCPSKSLGQVVTETIYIKLYALDSSALVNWISPFFVSELFYTCIYFLTR